ncbi:MAG TPA: ATP-binding protein [Desulfomonilaceae bacterium]|nr:ATP-binding protein [Desulfomonilaceae bacterium]
MFGRAAKGANVRRPVFHTRSYAKLLRRFILVSVTCSVLPLLLVGWASYLYYSQFSLSRMADYFQKTVEYNRKIVESFLQERTADVKLVAYTNSLDYLKDPSNLKEVFHLLNLEGSHFTDLGVIGKAGKYLSYVGPYDLMDKDYSETFWFKEVKEKGVYISDVFMGYRKVPHVIIAVLGSKGEGAYVLRATIYSEFLTSLVETAKLGQTGEVFLVNREGIYQTGPRFKGKIMDQASLPMNSFTGESGILITDPIEPQNSFSPERGIPITDLIKYGLMQSRSQQVLAYSWLKHPDWLLVVKQDFSEVFGDINHVNTAILVLLHASILAILIVSVFTAKYMIKVIKKRDQEAEGLNRQLMQASKLASIGELAAGVAHEINNPLAVILTENQVIRDLTEDEQNLDANFRDELVQSLSQIDTQVERCSHITQNLLRFSRRISVASQFIDLNVSLKHVVGLLEKRASSYGVQISLDFQEKLPKVSAFPFELEQVFVNLINNAIDAHDGKPYGSINIATRFDSSRNGLVTTVADTGSGIPDSDLERIFDPFFTTKPVGKGTGLGLSISYSIIRQMGGDISVQSELGKGTEFTVFLPCPAAAQSEILEGPRKDDLNDKA